MADEHAIPEKTQEKTQGDKLDGVLETTQDKTAPSQESTRTIDELEPADEPLK